MIVLTIKVKKEATTYSKKEFLDDNFSISKQNPILHSLVAKAVEVSNLDNDVDNKIDPVKLIARFEW